MRAASPRRFALHVVILIGVLVAVLGLGDVPAPAVAAESSDPAEELAKRYVPIIVTKDQAEACDEDGEAYRPVAVDVLLGRDDVVLRGEDGAVLITGPTAADLYEAGPDTNIDMPVDSVQPDCDFEQWFKSITDGVPTTVYAHVVVDPDHPGKVALQYWLYWMYNDWNNRHESDWEMIQLDFEADTVADALNTEPFEVGYAQHEGAERSTWDASKLSKVGDSPVVYVGRGSHASYYESTLYLGHSAEEGFGCDDTRGPSTQERPEVVMLPDAPTGPDDPVAWLGYTGRWGQRASGPNDGEVGITFLEQWEHPLEWAAEHWRDASTTVPASSGLAPSTTNLFCRLVNQGSKVYLRLVSNPLLTVGLIGLVVLGFAGASRRTKWKPAAVVPIDQRRHAGELFTAALRIYRRRPLLFLGIGLVFVPLGALGAVIQRLLFHHTPIGTIVDVAASDQRIGIIASLAIGSGLTLLATVFVHAATASVLWDSELSNETVVRSYRSAGRRVGTLSWLTFRVAIVVVLLSITIVGIPFAIVYAVRRQLSAQAAILELDGATEALSRSHDLTTPGFWRTFLVTTLANAIALAVGPLIGIVVLLVWSPALEVVNIVSSAVYVGLVPYAGIVFTLLFYDLRRRRQLPAS